MEAKSPLLDAVTEGNLYTAKKIFDEECTRYYESLKMPGHSKTEIVEKLQAFQDFFQHLLIIYPPNNPSEKNV